MIGLDCYLEEVIITFLDKRGAGIKGDPVRRVQQIWTKKGQLIMEKDAYEKCPHCKKELHA